MSVKGLVVLKIGAGDLALALHPRTAEALGQTLIEGAARADADGRVIYINQVDDDKEEEIVDRLPEEPLPEPEGVVERWSPAVEEALEYGDHTSVVMAPKAIIDLGNALYDIEVKPESALKVREVIRLLQQVVGGA